ncbi:MAG: tRNA-modifying protein YgfZ [Candidatus Dasytiphilus stammeri]
MNELVFPYLAPVESKSLPLTLISLEEWCMISMTGVDTFNYIQKQITFDITTLQLNQYCQTAHCNAEGKMWSNLLLFHYNGGLAWIIRRSVQNLQMEALKKYAIFSKVMISATNDILMGIAGFQARAILSQVFARLPSRKSPLIYNKNMVLLWLNNPSERFIIISNIMIIKQLQEQLSNYCQLNNSRQWMSLDIEAGNPIIDNKNCCKFIPQAANLDLIGAINFQKGCYLGQEIIARATFRGINKYALYWLSGKLNNFPKSTRINFINLNNSKPSIYYSANILAICKMANNEIWIQAILKKDLPYNTIFRMDGDDESYFYIRPISYL